jgi:hypothetical protein
MSANRFVHTLIAGISFCASIAAQTVPTPVVVYENSTNYTGKFNMSANEYGDEIILLGNAHFITQFQFEYVGNFVAQGDETARLRFYANTGPNWQGATNADYATPAAIPLWETVIPISSGFNTATVTVPYVDVPLRFTWTIQFFGITMATNDNAGLLFYGQPTIGSSFNDYWELLTTGWWLERYLDIPHNNFAAKIMAVAALPPPTKLGIALNNGNLVFSWPVGLTSLYLESKSTEPGSVWEPVLPLALRVGDIFQTTVPMGSGNRIFRLNSQPQPPMAILADASGGVKLRWSSAVGGQKIQTKATLSDTTWTDVPTPTRPNGDFYETVIPAGTGAAFFRLSRAQ